ncbi:MAG TPA: hypothetical protein VKZ18_08030 [Polyangia bacterium]|jgi:hypothetical protein|nr:hypothetical protein [Polyangia bacterium]
MSAKHRTLWIVPAFIVASWLAVRSLAALPAYEMDDPPLATSSPHIADPVLAEMITRFARDARGPRK